MNFIKTLFFLLLFPTLGFSQNIVFIGENSYSSTDTYEFMNDENPVFVSFLKSNEGILISLKQKDYLEHENPRIDGKIMVYLDNGKVLKINAPTVVDFVDSKMNSIYLLSKEDIDNVKVSNINSIRFTRIDKYDVKRDRIAKNSYYDTTSLLNNFFN